MVSIYIVSYIWSQFLKGSRVSNRTHLNKKHHEEQASIKTIPGQNSIRIWSQKTSHIEHQRYFLMLLYTVIS